MMQANINAERLRLETSDKTIDRARDPLPCESSDVFGDSNGLISGKSIDAYLFLFRTEEQGSQASQFAITQHGCQLE